MEETKCISSHLMTSLLAWRNPQGPEEEWIGHHQGVDNRWKHVGKVLSTEIGLCLLATASIVETVAYAALTLASLILYPITDRPCVFFTRLLQSSSFTIIWGIANALFYNPVFVNVMTRESFARYWAEKFNPTPFELFRLEDALDIIDWAQQRGQENTMGHAMLNPILAAGQATQEIIDQGANFIKQDVLSGVSPETLTLFKEMAPSVYMFILTRAVYVYAAGSKRNDAVPDFFKLATRNSILNLRSELEDKETIMLNQLAQITSDLTQFDTEPQNEDVRSAFGSLRIIASGELQGSLFATRCWQRAAEMLSQ